MTRSIGEVLEMTWTPRVAASRDDLGPRAPIERWTEDEGTALVADPFGSIPPGAFFGGHAALAGLALPIHPGFACGASAWAIPMRHVPTPAVTARLREVFGRPAETLLDAWVALWERLSNGDVAALAERMGYEGLDTWERRVDMPMAATTARRMAAGAAFDFEAARLFAMDADARRQPARDPALHAMEDAAMQVALEAAGASWCVLSNPDDKGRALKAAIRREGSRAGRGKAWRLPPRTSRAALEAIYASPPYWRTRGFRRACDRPMQQASDARHAAMVLHHMALQGHARAFLKHCRAKAGTWVVDLAGIASPRDALGALARAMGPAAFSGEACGLAAEPARITGEGWLLIQAFRRFDREARFFVVAGKIVGSTPSDRLLSPLDAHEGPGRLDPRVAVLLEPPGAEGPYDRGMTRTQTDRALVAAMARKVRAIARAISADPVSEAAFGHAYIVDVGAHGDGPDDVEVIELNRFRLAATYAARTRPLADAIAGARGWKTLKQRVADAREDVLSLLARRDPAGMTEAMDMILRRARITAPMWSQVVVGAVGVEVLDGSEGMDAAGASADAGGHGG